jgi:hypothetical protein
MSAVPLQVREKRSGVEAVHAAAAQVCPAGHVTPQRPQFAGSFWRFAQLVPHAVSPVLQVGPPTQLPRRQMGRVQARPQPPQCWLLELVSTHAPPQLV